MLCLHYLVFIILFNLCTSECTALNIDKHQINTFLEEAIQSGNQESFYYSLQLFNIYNMRVPKFDCSTLQLADNSIKESYITYYIKNACYCSSSQPEDLEEQFLYVKSPQLLRYLVLYDDTTINYNKMAKKQFKSLENLKLSASSFTNEVDILFILNHVYKYVSRAIRSEIEQYRSIAQTTLLSIRPHLNDMHVPSNDYYAFCELLSIIGTFPSVGIQPSISKDNWIQFIQFILHNSHSVNSSKHFYYTRIALEGIQLYCPQCYYDVNEYFVNGTLCVDLRNCINEKEPYENVEIEINGNVQKLQYADDVYYWMIPKEIQNDHIVLKIRDVHEVLVFEKMISLQELRNQYEDEDIHLNNNNHEGSYNDFRQFVEVILPKIKPDLIVNTGDITCSKMHKKKDRLQLEEWYSNVLKKNGLFNLSKWIDTRGNHDAFVHYNGIHPYKEHTVFGAYGKEDVYEMTYHTDSGDLRFIGIDANAPLFRHFNGFLLPETLDRLEHILASSTTPTILFTHYPLFTMDQRAKSSQGHTLLDLIQIYKPMYYLCGHMHSAIGGMVTRRFNTIEAEQFDFKDARQYRIYSYYKGQISFTTYNMFSQESPIVIIHSPIDVRYELKLNEDNSIVFLTIVNVDKPMIQLIIDEIDYSASPEITIENKENKTNVLFKPYLSVGQHRLQCIVTNQQAQRRTIVERLFQVHTLHSNALAAQLNYPSFHSSLLQKKELPMITSYALEYPISKKTEFVMKIDWSHLMLYLNPLIIIIIVLFYWGCRTLSRTILRKQQYQLLTEIDYVPFTTSFLATDRAAKYMMFKEYFKHYPWLFKHLFSRLFLFTSDDYIFYGIMISLGLHFFLPSFFTDEIGNLCCFSLFGYHNFSLKQHYKYMDPYVFGHAFYYAILVLFTCYMFLFASPSITKFIPYNIISYVCWILDVGCMYLFYKCIIAGRYTKNYETLLSLLLQLNEPISLFILFILIIREKIM